MVLFCVDETAGKTPKDTEPKTLSYTITVENGSISGQKDAEGKYLHNKNITLTANPPQQNYKFVSWVTEGMVLTNNFIYKFSATQDGHYVATYEEIEEVIDHDWRPEPGEPGFADRKDLYRFYDDFSKGDISDNNMLDTTKWGYEEKGDGFGNSEMQFYHRDNIRIINDEDKPGNRKLVITMRKENRGTGSQARNYTSGKFWSKPGNGSNQQSANPGFAATYGKVEARIRLFNKLIEAGYTPNQMAGLWPAFWMMPSAGVYGGWPQSGEIDIAEVRGRFPGQINSTIHRRAQSPTQNGDTWVAMGSSGGAGKTPGVAYSTGTYPNDYLFSDSGTGTPAALTCGDWRVYCVEWEYENNVLTFRYYVDDILFFTIRENMWRAFSTDGELNKPKPFDRDFYLIFNLALGGNFDGNRTPANAAGVVATNNTVPENAPIFTNEAPPIEYEIDWVVWREIMPRSGKPGEVQKPIYPSQTE